MSEGKPFCGGFNRPGFDILDDVMPEGWMIPHDVAKQLHDIISDSNVSVQIWGTDWYPDNLMKRLETQP